jgi:hypothetical protein
VTATPTITATVTQTPTVTQTVAATQTPTRTPTPTQTATATVTQTPTATPTASICPVNEPVPDPTSGNGTYFVITTGATGNITATWTLNSANKIRVLIYSGTPYGAGPSGTTTTVAGGAIADTGTAHVTSQSITASSQPAGTYTVLFFASQSGATTASASINYEKNGCP